MTIFIDYEFKCHAENDGKMRAYETAFFDGKCKPFIEGYRLIPEGEVLIQENGETMGPQNESIFPWRPADLLQEFQKQYEDMRAALETIYSGVTE